MLRYYRDYNYNEYVKIVHFQELADIMMDPPPNCSAGPKVYNTLKYAV